MSFSVVNSSFILDRRLRSIRLWAVLRAIFRPAALVVLGCFFLPLAAGADDPLPDDSFAAFPVEPPPLPPPPPPADLPVGLCCVLGFIWMILRVRVGGGGRSLKSSNGRLVPDKDCREPPAWPRPLPTAMKLGDTGEAGIWSDLEDLLLGAESIAAGGKAKTSVPSMVVCCWSLTLNSPDMEGVGRRRERDMVVTGRGGEDERTRVISSTRLDWGQAESRNPESCEHR